MVGIVSASGNEGTPPLSGKRC